MLGDPQPRIHKTAHLVNRHCKLLDSLELGNKCNVDLLDGDISRVKRDDDAVDWKNSGRVKVVHHDHRYSFRFNRF